MATTKSEGPKLSFTILSVVVSTLLVAVLNYGTAWVMKDTSKGEVIMGPVTVIDGKRFASLDIVNHSQSPLTTVKLAVPAQTNISTIQASEPVQMWQDQQLKTGKTQLISLAGFPAGSAIRILVPLPTEHDQAYISNASDLRLRERYFWTVESPRDRILRTVILDTAVYGAMFTLFTLIGYYYNRRFFQKADRAHETIQEEQKKISAELAALKKNETHVKAVLVRRFSECSQELDFWRDTIRAVLGAKQAITADKIISGVTGILGTYSTQGKTRASLKEVVALSEALMADGGVLKPATK